MAMNIQDICFAKKLTKQEEPQVVTDGIIFTDVDNNGNPIKAELKSTKTKIPDSMFYDFKQLTDLILPNTIEVFGNSAFGNCYNLTNINFPEDLKEINQSCFYYCSKLLLTTIPSKVETIKQSAFVGCSKITEITFLGTPTSISSNSFLQCDNIADIYVPWAENEVANAPWGATNATIHYNYTPQS